MGTQVLIVTNLHYTEHWYIQAILCVQAVTCRYSGRTEVPGVLSNPGLYIGQQIWYPIYVIAVFVTRNFGGGFDYTAAQ